MDLGILNIVIFTFLLWFGLLYLVLCFKFPHLAISAINITLFIVSVKCGGVLFGLMLVPMLALGALDIMFMGAFGTVIGWIKSKVSIN